MSAGAVKRKRKQTAAASKASRIYWAKCSVCQYMKTHQDFRLAVMNSSYFNIYGEEKLSQVLLRYNVEFNLPLMYAHFKRHQPRDIQKKIDDEKNELYRARKKGLIKPKFIQGVPLEVLGTDVKAHEIGLDDFIKLGHEKLRRAEMPINAATYLQAIKIKADIDKSNKDRGVDVFKTMFRGAAPSEATNEGEKVEDGTG